MISNILSERAEAAAARYERLLASYQVLYSRALSGGVFEYVGRIAETVAEAERKARIFLEEEKDWIAKDLYEIASEAQGRVQRKLTQKDAEELTDAALEHLKLTQSFLTDELVAQLQRDIATLRRELQKATLDVRMMARANGISESEAAWRYRMDHDDLVLFHFLDRRSRKMPSRSFIRTIWRMSLLSAYNETVLFTLVDHGIDRAGVVRFEDGVEKQVDVISLSGDAPGYAAVRDTYFHPNANAYLDLEAVDV